MNYTNQTFRIWRAMRLGIVMGTLMSAVPAAAGTSDVIIDLGTKALGILFSIGGVAAAISFAVIGLRLTASSIGGSSMRMGEALMSLGACALGVALAFLGPVIAESLIKGLGGIKKDIYVP